jgi:hypothetical protein
MILTPQWLAERLSLDMTGHRRLNFLTMSRAGGRLDGRNSDDFLGRHDR